MRAPARSVSWSCSNERPGAPPHGSWGGKRSRRNTSRRLTMVANLRKQANDASFRCNEEWQRGQLIVTALPHANTVSPPFSMALRMHLWQLEMIVPVSGDDRWQAPETQ